jgi:hypothetical protein
MFLHALNLYQPCGQHSARCIQSRVDQQFNWLKGVTMARVE